MGLVGWVTGCGGSGDAREPGTTAAVAALPTSTTAPATNHSTETTQRGAATTAVPSADSGLEPAPIRWSPCAGSLECGTLTVPRDHAEPSGATLELAVARRPAPATTREGAILANPGGPGASGIEFLAGFTLSGPLAERFDLVSWDPRGVGASSPVQCGGDALTTWLAADPAPDDAAEREALGQAAQAVALECARLDGDLLPHLGTEATVADMELLRQALGDDQISYLGLSYGTLIGQLYLEAHPERVRAMVLDGVVDSADGLAQLARAQAVGFEEAFARVAAGCRPGGCPLDDPDKTYDELAIRVENEPLPAGAGTVGPAELQIATEFGLYSPALTNLMLRALADAQDGDGRRLASLARSYHSAASYTAYAAVVCLDLAPPDDAGFDELAADLAAVAPRFGVGLAYELLPCASWPTPPNRDPAPVIRPSGAPPVLVVATTGDPATPPDAAERVAARLEGRLLIHDGEGHVALGSSSCATDAIRAYLTDLTLPPEGARC